MTVPCQSACEPWIAPDDPLFTALCSTEADADLVETEIAIASDLLYELSGRRFPGFCSDVIRPCASVRETSDEYVGVARRWWQRDLGTLGTWGGYCACQTGPACGCSSLSEIYLDRVPVSSVERVKVADFSNPAWPGDATLDPALYRVDDFARLVRLPNPDGSRPSWPCCQRIDLDAGEENTFEVAFTYGVRPPPAGQQAAAALACELIRSFADPDNCRFSPRTQQIARQGVTVVLDRMNNIKNDLTGLPAVDLFLRAYNPSGNRRRMRVAVPGMPARARRAGT